MFLWWSFIECVLVIVSLPTCPLPFQFQAKSLSAPRHAKKQTVFGHMRTANAQISLRIRIVWSGPFLPTDKIIGRYSKYQCRANGRMRFGACLWWVCILRMLEDTFSLCAAHNYVGESVSNQPTVHLYNHLRLTFFILCVITLQHDAFGTTVFHCLLSKSEALATLCVKPHHANMPT